MIFPSDLDKKFLINFKKVIEKYVKKNHKFIIICGGGRLARAFQQIASEARNLNSEELDWLGIYATMINASILRSLFGSEAEQAIISNPNSKIKFKKNIVIASGWIPGWSTDYDAVLFAKNAGAKEVINMSNIDYVYNKDPGKHKDAKKIENLSWNDYRKLSGNVWKAGMSMPFDPIAAKEAQKSKIRVYVVGNDLLNLQNLLDGRKFKGTVIE